MRYNLKHELNKHMEKNHVVGKLKPCSDPAYEPLGVCPVVQGISASLGLRGLAQLGEAQSREGTFGTCKCSLETTSHSLPIWQALGD